VKNYNIEEVKDDEKDILYNLLQFALYDGSKYIENKINNNAVFEYKWFDSYFTDENRYAYFIKDNSENLIGFAMLNQNMKILPDGYSVAEFLILPSYRRNHIGKKVAFELFSKFKGNWEVEPIENSEEAYNFWKNVISDYTNNNYEYKNQIFIFNNKNN
jgi:predicted acetyltransferase